MNVSLRANNIQYIYIYIHIYVFSIYTHTYIYKHTGHTALDGVFGNYSIISCQ